MNNELYSGLTQKEANKALAAWLTDRRLPKRHSEENVDFECVIDSQEQVAFIEVDQDCDSTIYPFTESLDSLVLIRLAMNREEQGRYVVFLAAATQFFKASSDAWSTYDLVNASAANQCRAALSALGLGKEPK